MSSAGTIQAVHAYFDAISAGDVEAYANAFAVDCHLQDPVDGPALQGRGAAQGFMTGVLSLVTGVKIRPGKIYVNGNYAAVPWTLECMGRNGKFLAADGVDVMEFNAEGKIQRLTGHWDAASFVAALTS